MAFSSYQIERLIERLRRWRGWFAESAYQTPAPVDPVRVSPDGKEKSMALGGPSGKRPSREGGMAAVAEKTAYPPEVERERERRAGIFKVPPQIPPADPIPKLRREKAERQEERSVSVGTGD